MKDRRVFNYCAFEGVDELTFTSHLLCTCVAQVTIESHLFCRSDHDEAKRSQRACSIASGLGTKSSLWFKGASSPCQDPGQGRSQGTSLSLPGSRPRAELHIHTLQPGGEQGGPRLLPRSRLRAKPLRPHPPARWGARGRPTSAGVQVQGFTDHQ